MLIIIQSGILNLPALFIKTYLQYNLPPQGKNGVWRHNSTEVGCNREYKPLQTLLCACVRARVCACVRVRARACARVCVSNWVWSRDLKTGGL